MALHKISPAQREIITAVQLNAKQPVVNLARQLGMRVHSLRYHLSSLEERGLIKQAAFLNLYPLGYRYVNLYFFAECRQLVAGRRISSSLDLIAPGYMARRTWG